jgi:orotidine-5'-phosphate decarboxylase
LSFLEKLLQASRDNDSLLCVGLDIDLTRVPVSILEKDDPIFSFNRAIIDATADLVCAYKPNLAFYEAMGLAGIEALLRTVRYIPANIPIIGDAKRGDIGHTSAAYARSAFEFFGFDAITISPYLGSDSVQPFLEREDKAAFILCKTSNPGGGDFQDLMVGDEESGRMPLYQKVAQKTNEWNVKRNCGLVVGATYPEELRRVREICPDLPVLIPGVGAQAGDLRSAVQYGTNANGDLAIINSSRGVLYASQGDDFAGVSREVADATRVDINRYRPGRTLAGEA